jgi:fatty acid desaturase
MEYHLEHHLFPAVPCYRLADIRAALDPDLPPRQTIIESCRDILRHRAAGWCGHGDNPLRRFLAGARFGKLLDNPAAK